MVSRGPVTSARRFWRRYALLAAPACLGVAALALLGPGGWAPEAHAYWNCAESDIMKGGPHRTLNELALKHFFKNLPAGDVRAAYVDAPKCTAGGVMAVGRSDSVQLIEDSALDQFFKTRLAGDVRAAYAHAPDCTVKGVMAVGRSDMVQLIEDSRAATWKEWVIEGGFSADEPEIYNSFRHFYDPLALNPNPRYYSFSPQGVPYLTDHLAQINTYLKPSLAMYLKPKFAAAAWAANITGRWYADVQVDARDWAVNGSKGEGYWENAYCWKKGVECFRTAFAGQENGKPLSGEERDKRFAQAWRALGETMHLLADMCCPPHVRNDSHPGRSVGAIIYGGIGISPGSDSHDPNVGVLKNDPYELWCEEPLVRECGKLSAPENVEITLRTADSPMDLFHTVATFTNGHFFSADTIPFHVVGSDNLWVANGCKPYALPVLRALTLEKGYYVATIWEHPVKLCHMSWLTNAGWGGELYARRITYPCIQDQAAILVPLAKSALARLADWFVPKLELAVEGYDSATMKLTLKVKHTPYGAFPEELLYSDAKPTCRLLFDTYIQQRWDLYTVSADKGKLTLDLSRLPVKPETMAKVELDVGGLRLRSADVRLDAPPKPTITIIMPIQPPEVPFLGDGELGVPVHFKALVENEPDKPEYEWEYGDGVKRRVWGHNRGYVTTSPDDNYDHRYYDVPAGPVRLRLYSGESDKVLAEGQAAVTFYIPPPTKGRHTEKYDNGNVKLEYDYIRPHVFKNDSVVGYYKNVCKEVVVSAERVYKVVGKGVDKEVVVGVAGKKPVDVVMHGNYRRYYDDGKQLETECQYRNGSVVPGSRVWYDGDGTVIRTTAPVTPPDRKTKMPVR